MKFFVTASTDIGNTKSINQDSVLIKQMRLERHNMALAVVCDGMGGGSKGEVASASVVKCFNDWANDVLPDMIRANATREQLRDVWIGLVKQISQKMLNYGRSLGIVLGTTAAVLLLIDDQYFILNVGDCRVYEIRRQKIQQLTLDQTVVAREVRMGIITPEQAMTDHRQHMLLQSIGASSEIIPDIFIGKVYKNSTFLVCSDGFRRTVSNEELRDAFAPEFFENKFQLRQRADEIIQLNKQRREADNISVALIRTY